MNIAGVMVIAQPSLLNQVEQQLLQLDGVEVHAHNENGRMVVTVESETEQQVADLLSHISELDGVISAAMVYHSFNEQINEQIEEEVVS